jgi:putative transcriptional regulator
MKMPQTMKIVVDLKSYLDKIGMSQRKLADITGVRYATINDICRGLVEYIHLDNLAIICETLGINPCDIIRYEKMTEEELEAKRKEYEEKYKSYSKGLKKREATLKKKQAQAKTKDE